MVKPAQSPVYPDLVYPEEGRGEGPKIKSSFVVFSILYFFILLFPQPTTAALTPGLPIEQGGKLGEFQEALADPGYNKEQFDVNTFVNGLNGLNLAVVGCAKPDPQTCPKGVGSGGVASLLASSVDWLIINQPASGVTYLAYLGRNLGLVKPAYAQGEGFTTLLQPLLTGWRVARNIAYGLFVVLFVVIAFAIMFRMRLDPQTVITIQSAIPRVIIALLLVTFSYAIAGLLLDLSKVVTALIGAVLSQIPGGSWTGFFNTFLTLITSAVLGTLATSLIGALLGFLAGGPAGAVVGIFAGAAAGIIGGTLLLTLFLILLIFAMARLVFIILMAYIGIVLRTIFAPFIILFNAMPGRPIFLGWLLPLIADISVFVTIPALLQIALFLMGTTDLFLRGFWTGGAIGIPFLQVFIVLAMLLLAPNIVNMVKEAINRPLQLGGLPGLGLIRGGAYATYEGLKYSTLVTKYLGQPLAPGQLPTGTKERLQLMINALMRWFGTGRF